MRRAFIAILLLLVFLLSGVGSASAYIDAEPKNRVGDFFGDTNEVIWENAPPALGNTRGNHFSRYDSATGVWDYVVQNPWSRFDPLGLAAGPMSQFDTEVDAKAMRGLKSFTVRTAGVVASVAGGILAGNNRLVQSQWQSDVENWVARNTNSAPASDSTLNARVDGQLALNDALASGRAAKGASVGGGKMTTLAKTRATTTQRPSSKLGGPTAKDVKTVTVDKTKYPEAAGHLEEAGVVGKPLTVDRAGVTARRKARLKGVKTEKGKDRDEAPPAVFKEGSKSVKLIDRSDNRGAGGSLGKQLRGVKDGEQVIIQTEKPKEN